MVFSIGGLIQVLKEKKCYVQGMKLEDMRKVISNYSDFANEKTKLEHFRQAQRHICIMLPKFHCELNPTECCWAQSKRYTSAYATYTFPGLRRNIQVGLDTVTLENIKKNFRKVRHYLFAYLEGKVAGPDLEILVKSYKSHRRIAFDK
jgi:transposase